MKARLLKKLLNDTKYSVSNHKDYIAVGSPLCHDLISVNKSTLKVKYALDTFNEGRKYLEGKNTQELLFIWDKLHELIASGEIHDIINGKDIIENPLPVFTIVGGQLVESITDEYGWPNTDDDGYCMYENTHFPTVEQAIEYGIKDYGYAVESATERVKQLAKELKEAEDRRTKYENYIYDLKSLLNSLLTTKK